MIEALLEEAAVKADERNGEMIGRILGRLNEPQPQIELICTYCNLKHQMASYRIAAHRTKKLLTVERKNNTVTEALHQLGLRLQWQEDKIYELRKWREQYSCNCSGATWDKVKGFYEHWDDC